MVKSPSLPLHSNFILPLAPNIYRTPDFQLEHTTERHSTEKENKQLASVREIFPALQALAIPANRTTRGTYRQMSGRCSFYGHNSPVRGRNSGDCQIVEDFSALQPGSAVVVR